MKMIVRYPKCTMMKNNRIIRLGTVAAFVAIAISSCKPPELIEKTVNTNVPVSYATPDTLVPADTAATADSMTTAQMNWREYFTDSNLVALIDTALIHNQELNITLQQIRMFNNEIRSRSGEYLPFVSVGAGGGVEKSPRYSRNGATEANLEIEPGKAFPDPLPDVGLGLYADWEIDIWNRLHNAKDAAVKEYLASIEGKNFIVTNLIAEIANSYYELLALDNQLAIVKQNIQIQSNALEIVKVQKQAARVTELAVRKFEAELMNTKSLQYDIQQQITVTENKINFLLGRYPQPIVRNASGFIDLVPDTVYTGLPSELLANRPDIRRAELEMQAADLNVLVAKASFYPRLSINAGLGYSAYNPGLMFTTPASLLYNIAGELTAPLFNKRAITAAYYNANARQVQAIYEYEQAILNGYMEVSNQMAMIENLEQSYKLRSQQVDALNASIQISTDLFKSARADYMEVLMTQRDALESKFELLETKKRQMNAMVNIYRALGGGWN